MKRSVFMISVVTLLELLLVLVAVLSIMVAAKVLQLRRSAASEHPSAIPD